MNNNIELLTQNNIDVKGALELWGDLDTYNESLKEFKNSLKEKLNNLENYKNNHDLNNYSILVHSLKSEAKYLGFTNEAEIFLSHELKSKENNQNYIDNDFNNLKNTVNKILALLNNYFGEEAEKKNLLIADDSNIILNFLEKSINKEYNIIKANDGNEALSKIANQDIYALLLDLNMPGLNGFEVLTYLKEHNLYNFPVVIITGDDTEETIKQAFNYPILEILNKPFNEKSINRILISIENFYENH